MRPIAFIASYPRSGNTFLRALLANYDSGRDQPLSVDEIGAYGMGEKREAFWRTCTQVSAETRTLEQEWRARPQYIAMSRTLPGSGPLMFKTHTLNGLAYDTPSFGIQADDRAIYLVRHPLDVLVSGAHFFDVTPAKMAERMILPGAVNSSNGAAPFEATGSWAENVAGWLNERRCPVLMVKYRDLCLDTAGTLTRVLTFVGRPVQAARVEQAVRFSAFEGLQQSHLRHGFDQGPGKDRRAPFFRAGRLDQWKSSVPDELIRKIDEECGPLMQALGFERPPVRTAFKWPEGRRSAVNITAPPAL